MNYLVFFVGIVVMFIATTVINAIPTKSEENKISLRICQASIFLWGAIFAIIVVFNSPTKIQIILGSILTVSVILCSEIDKLYLEEETPILDKIMEVIADFCIDYFRWKYKGW